MKHLSQFPRLKLAILPTPLQKMENLSRVYGKSIYFKRDDMTGVALGGNKVRKLEFLLADAMEKGADTIMTTGGAQSNHAMLTAACGSKLGLHTMLLLKKRGVTDRIGNQLLNDIFGAQVDFFDTDRYSDIYEEMSRRKAQLKQEGRTGYEIPVGGSTALGALGYVECFQETVLQCRALGFLPDRMVCAVGSGGTYAGLCAGADLFAPEVRVTGIAVDNDPFEKICAQLKMEIGGLLELNRILGNENIEIHYNCGAGYGIPGPRDSAAVRRLASLEGVLLDPVYTGKAFSLFLRMLEEDAFAGEEHIVFLHSGGAGGIFAVDLPSS